MLNTLFTSVPPFLAGSTHSAAAASHPTVAPVRSAENIIKVTLIQSLLREEHFPFIQLPHPRVTHSAAHDPNYSYILSFLRIE